MKIKQKYVFCSPRQAKQPTACLPKQRSQRRKICAQYLCKKLFFLMLTWNPKKKEIRVKNAIKQTKRRKDEKTRERSREE